MKSISLSFDRNQVIERLMKEDKSGLAYCMNQIMGLKSLGYSHYMFCTKKELREKLSTVTDLELERLSSFKTYSNLFS